ncbi:hypothetical protein IPV09_03100 [Tessaracoccus sp. SD287]|uniref:hypothetical protein n=1 Tax=Tessaracoccus sp. SD287 TaxID=2782008 RepID=UPI001A9724FC|nr:hypothetical protein [Tessaracoccus sp. SD287]MBO1030322.1 hypothetical protein [Tessaracoccus sp. SD287]
MNARPERATEKREFGRDGITGLVGWDRALRAREVSRPNASDLAQAERVVADLLARAQGRRRR